jgi:hypothetical protein
MLSPTQKKALELAQFKKSFCGEIHANTTTALQRKGLIESLGSGYYELTEKGWDALQTS